MRRLFRALFGTLVVTQMAYGKVERLRTPAGTKTIVGLLLGASAADACAARGAARGGALVGSAAALGFATELVGVATGKPFGHYTYSSMLGRKVGGVPVAAAGAWAMMARPAWVVAGCSRRRRAARVLAAAGALTAWDVFLDPQMERDGYWSWPGGGRYEGIPASNFAGWLATGAGVFGVWALSTATTTRCTTATARSRCTRGRGSGRSSRMASSGSCCGSRPWAASRWAPSPSRRCSLPRLRPRRSS